MMNFRTKHILIQAYLATSLLAFATTAISKTTNIKAGKIHESCLKLKASEVIKYRFKASNNVAFNIHYHLGEKIKYPVKMDSIKQHSDTFKASFAQQYCLMWSNKGSEAVTLEYSH